MNIITIIKKKFKEGDQISIKLHNGQTLSGIVEGFENDTLAISRDSGSLDFIKSSSICSILQIPKDGKNSVQEAKHIQQKTPLLSKQNKDIQHLKRNPPITPKVNEQAPPPQKQTEGKSVERKDNPQYIIDHRPISALGRIDSIDESGISGIIVSKTKGTSYKFYEREIIDKNLIKNRAIGAPVVFSVIGIGSDIFAGSIHCPNTISNYILKAEKILKLDTIEERQTAFNIAIQILRQYPDSKDAQTLRDKLPKYLSVPIEIEEEDVIRDSNSKTTTTTNEVISTPAKKDIKVKITPEQSALIKSIQEETDNLKAIAKLKNLMNDPATLLTSFKQITDRYVKLYLSENNDEHKRDNYKDEMLRFIDNHKQDFQETKEFLNTLLQNYESVQEDNRIIETIEKLEKIVTDQSDMSGILTRKAQSLYNIGKDKEAIETITQAIDMNPGNDVARNKLKSFNLEFVDPGESDKDIEAPNLSCFLQQVVNNYTGYKGISEHDIPKRNFTKHGIDKIKNRVKYLKKQKNVEPKELAELNLSWTKVLAQIQPTNYDGMYSKLREFCNYKAYEEALQPILKADVIRFYLQEFVGLLTLTVRSNAANIIILKYLTSYQSDSRKLLRAFNQNIKKDVPKESENILEDLCNYQDFDILWDGLMTFGQRNGAIADSLSSICFSCGSFRDKSIHYMHDNDIDITVGATEDQFRKAWNEASLKHSRQNHDTINRLVYLTKTATIMDFVEKANTEINYCVDNNVWINQLDKDRILKIRDNTIPIIKNFVEDNKFQSKERYYTELVRDLERAKDGILRHPSSLTYNGIIQIINHIGKLSKESFDRVIESSEPKLNIKLLNNDVIADKEGVASLQFSVYTQSAASPISQIELIVEPDKDITPKGEPLPAIYSKSLNGGNNAIFTQRIQISQDVIKSGGTGIRVTCNYRKRDNLQDHKEMFLPLRLKSEDSFTVLGNPYIVGHPLSFGIQGKKDMFYGRDELIGKIEKKLLAPAPYHCILYGQKRSGKTSIINKIKYDLGKKNGPFLCVEFSVTALLPRFTFKDLLYQIISTIGSELEDYQDDGIETPSYVAPLSGDFNKMVNDYGNEITAFKKELRKLNKAFKDMPSWENKRILLLIDEFTTIYNQTRQRKLDESFMEQWKAATQDNQFTISEVLIGQAITPKFQGEPYASNAFQVFENWEVTYLEPRYAKDLIIEPIRDDQGNSRYVETAYKKVYELTAGSPYYLQWMCSKIVDYINENKLLRVTEPDVNAVAEKMIAEMKVDNFDNLFDDGGGHIEVNNEKVPLEEKEKKIFTEINTKAILKAIAVGIGENGFCKRDKISIPNVPGADIDAILKDLYSRKVIQTEGRDQYKIIVKLFEIWINKNQATF